MVTLRQRNSSPRILLRRPFLKVCDVVEILWEDRGQAFRGQLLKRLRPRENVFYVSYDDGDKVWHDLDEHYWRLVGDKKWVPPSILWDCQAPPRGVELAESLQRKTRRKRALNERSAPELSSKSIITAQKKEATSRNASKPLERILWKSSSASSFVKPGIPPLMCHATSSLTISQSESSTKLSFSGGSTDENPEAKEHIFPTVIADDCSQIKSLIANEQLCIEQNNMRGITASSFKSNDEIVPPRKRKGFRRE